MLTTGRRRTPHPLKRLPDKQFNLNIMSEAINSGRLLVHYTILYHYYTVNFTEENGSN